MNFKKIGIIIILIIIIAGGFFYLPKILQTKQQPTPVIAIQDKTITTDTKPFVVKITYPFVPGLDNFNIDVLTAVNKELIDFKTNSLANDAAVEKIDPVDYAKYPREYDLTIGYDKGEVDDNVVSVILNVYNFEGGAHGDSYFVPVSYDVKNKKDLTLADLFSGQADYIQKISDYCIKDLTKQIIAELGSTNGATIQEGAGPTADNFSDFLVNKNNIVFYFPQYQVAFGAAGSFKVTMPR